MPQPACGKVCIPTCCEKPVAGNRGCRCTPSPRMSSTAAPPRTASGQPFLRSPRRSPTSSTSSCPRLGSRPADRPRPHRPDPSHVPDPADGHTLSQAEDGLLLGCTSTKITGHHTHALWRPEPVVTSSDRPRRVQRTRRLRCRLGGRRRGCAPRTAGLWRSGRYGPQHVWLRQGRVILPHLGRDHLGHLRVVA